MDDYLEALERLGKLLDAGVLTKEEFEQEKASLLASGRTKRTAVRSRLPRRYLVPLGVATATLIGGGIAYAVFSTGRVDSSSVAGASSVEAGNDNSAGTEYVKLAVSFADPDSCEPGTNFSDLLGRIREAAASEEGSDLRLIHLTGLANPVEVQSSSQDAAGVEVRLGRLPTSGIWRGLRVTEVRTTEWDKGTGFQLLFRASAENLLRVLRTEGFDVKAVSQPLSKGGRFIVLENTPGGSALTCMETTELSTQSDGDQDGRGTGD